MEFLVQRPQLLVGGLHFFGSGLKLFIDALQLLIGGEKLLIGRAQLFVGRFPVFEHRPGVVPHLGEFPLRLRYLGGQFVGARERPDGWRTVRRDCLGKVVKEDKERSLAGGRPDGDDIESGDHHPPVTKDADPAPMNGGLALFRFSKGTPQLPCQSLPGHAQKVVTHATGARLKVGAGVTTKPPYLQVGVDDHSCRRVSLEHDLVGFFGGIEVMHGGFGRRRGGSSTSPAGRGGWYRSERSRAGRVDLGLLVYDREKIGSSAHRLRLSE